MRVDKRALCQTGRIIVGLLGGVLMLALSLAFITGARIQAAPSRSASDADLYIRSITITADLPISDTHPGAGITKTVYFNNAAAGVITLTLEVCGTPMLTLTAGAAFGDPERVLTSSTPTWNPVVTYTIGTEDRDYPGVTYTVINTDGIHTIVTITYVRDITAPTILTPSIIETSDDLYAMGAALYYTNTMDLAQTFAVRGYSTDTGSGIERVHFSQAFGDSPGDAVSGFSPWQSEAYTIEPGETATEIITAAVYDHVGNVGVQTYTCELDSTPPTVTVDAPSIWRGLAPIPVAWQTGDTQSGVDRVRLYYRRVPTDTEWQDGGQEQTGLAGTFYFTPAGYLTYTFAIQATDNVGNKSTLPVTGVQVIVKPIYIYLPLILQNYPSSWQQAGGTDGVKFYDIAVCPSDHTLQYAGTGANGVYRSTDGGKTWQHWALDERATPVVVNPENCNEVFAATWGNGVYRITGQNQATPINQGLNELYLYGLVISEDGQTLYAGSNASGVCRTNTGDINWVQVNDGISDLRIRSLYLVGDTLYAGGRQCTYYYSDDGGGSWSPEVILNGGQGGECEDAQVWAVAEMDGALYASLGLEKGLHRKSARGAWEPVSDVPAVNIYRFGLHPYSSRLYVGTYGYGVYTCESDGHCRPLPNSGLGTDDVRGLTVAEIPDAPPRLLAGSDDGIWWVSLVP